VEAGREAGVGLYSEEGGEAGGETDLCLMGERDRSRPGGLRPGDQECFTDTGDTGLGDTGDTGGLDLTSGLPTMESMEKPSLFLISLLKIFGWTRLG